jgi:hypothetical protein
MQAKLLAAAVAGAALVGSVACSDANTARTGLAFSTRQAPGGTVAVTAATAGDSTVVALGNDTIIIRSVEMVLREIELKRIDAASCDSISGNDDCEEFETGPVLVSLPLGNGTEKVITVDLPAGTYDQLEVKVHKPEDGPGDTVFIAAHPGFAGVSIRVTGTYSAAGTRTDFVFTSDLDKEQETALNPPLTVTGGATNVTLRVDISTWFLAVGGTTLVDPSSANKGGSNEGVVKNNIEQSIEGLHDDNSDGRDDDHEGS